MRVASKHYLILSWRLLRPHVLALLLFLSLTIGFFYPVFLEKKALRQGDIQQYRGSVESIHKYSRKSGEEALWNPNIFSGMPTYVSGLRWRNTLLATLHSLLTLRLPHPVWVLFSSLLWSYVMLCCFGVRPVVAISGAFVFTFSSYLLIGLGAGHNSRVGAMVYIPMILAAVRLGYGRYWYLGAVLCALGVSFQLKANHIQMTYYTLFAVVFYMMFEIYWVQKTSQLRRFTLRSIVLLAAALLGFSTFYGQFSMLYTYSKYSIRGERILTPTTGEAKTGLDKNYAFQYSNEPLESMTLLVPNFYGGRLNEPLDSKSHTAKALRERGAPMQYLRYARPYRGEQPITSPYYVGASVFFLVLLALLILPARQKYWLLSLGVFALFLSWGKHFSWFNYLLFDLLPGYNKFRSPTFSTVLIVLAFALLSGLVLERSLQMGFDKSWKKRFFQAATITLGLFLLVQLFASVGSYEAPIDETLQQAGLPIWYIDALRADRLSLLRSDTWRGFFFVSAVVGLLYLIARGYLRPRWGLASVALLLLLDLLLVSTRYFNPTDSYEQSTSRPYLPTEADQRILQDSSRHFRVYGIQNSFNENRTSTYHRSVGGYHPAKLRRYQDIIERALLPERDRLRQSAKTGKPDLSRLPVSDMLNTKYFVFGSKETQILENDSPCGAAWLVERVVPVVGPDEEISTLQQINPCREATWDASIYPLQDTLYNTSGTVTLLRASPNDMLYKVETQGEALLLMSEVYYPDWRAYVNEKPKDLLRLNYLLRGLLLPAGTHKIRVQVDSTLYQRAKIWSWAGSTAILLLLLSTLSYVAYVTYRGHRQDVPLIDENSSSSPKIEA